MPSDDRPHKLDEAQVAKTIAVMERAYAEDAERRTRTVVHFGDTYREVKRALSADDLEDTVTIYLSGTLAKLPREIGDPFTSHERFHPQFWQKDANLIGWATAGEIAHGSNWKQFSPAAASSAARFLGVVRSGMTAETEAAVERALTERFGADVNEWLDRANGTNGRSLMLGDLEYVVKRLDRILNAGLVKIWLTSRNERLGSSPVSALAFRKVGEVVAAMDAEDQGAY